ncbi:MAG: efflux RND transporter permease subunit [Pseudomonadota bacterium]
MKHTELSLRRPVTISMIFAALAVIGLISSQLLPLEELPDLELPGFFIQIPYEGSTPSQTEKQITRPVEEALATMSGIKLMYSSSRENEASVWMGTQPGANAKTLAVEARVKLDAIRDQLPPDVERIQVFSGSLNDMPIMQLRVSSDEDLSEQYDLLNRLVKRRLERIEGVSQVQIQGVEPPEIRIRLDSGRLRAHSIDINELSTLLKRSNFMASAGQITADRTRWTVRPNGEFDSLQAVRDLVIDGRNLRLGDIAAITQAPKERTYGRHLDGNYAVGISISRATGYNMVAVADRVKEEVEAIGKLPAMRGIELFDLDNQANSVRKSLRELIESGVIGALLAIVVLYFFLRHLATTLIVTLSVPLSLIITMGSMYFFGLSINVLTLMGLMLAIGMLVDNSVVVSESVFRHRQDNPDNPQRATLSGVNEVGLAVIASTATSICVFAPLLVGGEEDIVIFMQHVGITISVAILCSLLVAQTLIPLLTSRLKNLPKETPGRIMPALTNAYTGLLGKVIMARGWRRIIAPLIALLILGSMAIPFTQNWLKVDMFPEEPTRRLFLPYNLNDIYALERVEQGVDRIEGFLFDNAERLDIRSVYSYWERGRAETTILLNDDGGASLGSREVMDIILAEKPDIAIGEPSFERNNQGFGEGFSVYLTGESTERLIDLTYDAWDILEQVEGLEDFSTDLTAGIREVQVRLDKEKASRYGVTAETLGNAISVALRGERLREFRNDTGEVEMRFAFRDNDRQTAEQLGNMVIPAFEVDGTPTAIPLNQVATLAQARGARSINRTNRKTSIAINAALKSDTTLDDIRPRVEKVMNAMDLPTGYGWSFGRGFDQNDEARNILVENITLGILLILIVMAALFESLLYPLSIMVSLVYSFVGVVWFLTLTSTPMTFMGMIGLMILIGVVVNNGIVLVDHINNLRRQGLPREQAVIQGGKDRIRPILMTAATTILGLTPLAFGDTTIGSQGPAYYPMARSIIGGLAFSTVVSLIVVPMTYVGLDKLKNWWTTIWKFSAPGASATT